MSVARLVRSRKSSFRIRVINSLATCAATAALPYSNPTEKTIVGFSIAARVRCLKSS